MNPTTGKELKFEQTKSELSLQDGYKKTEAGIIPVDWQVKSLAEISIIERGKFSARPRNDPKYFGGIIPFIQTGDISRSNGRNVTFSQTLNEKGLIVSRLFPKNSLYFTIAANIGDVALVDFESACPDSLVVFKEKQNIDKTWLYHALSDKKSEFEVIATSNAQLNINLEKLNPYLLSIPPKEEQTAIANALSDVDALIQELEKLIAKKQAIKTATMQQLLTGRTRLPQFAHHPDGRKKGYTPSEHGEIPEDWEVVSFSKLTRNIIDYRGRTPKKLGLDWGGGDIVALSAGNVKKGFIDFDEDCYFGSDELYKKWMKNGDVEQNDIVFTMEAPLGNVALIPDSRRYILSQRTILLQLHREHYDSIFVYQLMMSDQFQSLLGDSATGSTAQGIKRSRFEQLLLCLPSEIKEQTAIAKALSDMDQEIQALEKRLYKVRQIKQGMMQELLTGKTRLVKPAGAAE